jgi:hypothetical protein
MAAGRGSAAGDDAADMFSGVALLEANFNTMSTESSYLELLEDLTDSNRAVFMMAAAGQLLDDEILDLHAGALTAYKITILQIEHYHHPREIAALRAS